ncbi:hypothetical protein E2R51_03580 [Jeotgalibacillus sp. S-D1]|uniref:hypothetical protein n=1 Tax=Jeotgalibacillus sp. S-D1 TaxID=2552189 RepID=UPI0010599DC4|nr:hypothetical protein [Jeotgalibacillus sp. S-D1]TDL34814.1 hypothetical protein E2R51_03580 [Jeotgalibacillus sp. S-D1]
MTFSDQQLLHAYKSLWKERSIPSEQSPAETLSAAVKKELKDELTHPRLRKSPSEKLYLAFDRIVHSSLTEKEKANLLHFYALLYKNINE